MQSIDFIDGNITISKVAASCADVSVFKDHVTAFRDGKFVDYFQWSNLDSFLYGLGIATVIVAVVLLVVWLVSLIVDHFNDVRETRQRVETLQSSVEDLNDQLLLHRQETEGEEDEELVEDGK